MSLRNAAFAGLALALLAGCKSTPPSKADPVEVGGAVTLPSGSPAPAGVTLNFFPTSADQTQVPVVLKAGGKYTAQLVPGKYTYAFEGTGVKAIPAKYHENQAAHTVEVPSGGKSDLDIPLSAQ